MSRKNISSFWVSCQLISTVNSPYNQSLELQASNLPSRASTSMRERNNSKKWPLLSPAYNTDLSQLHKASDKTQHGEQNDTLERAFLPSVMPQSAIGIRPVIGAPFDDNPVRPRTVPGGGESNATFERSRTTDKQWSTHLTGSHCGARAACVS